MRDYSALDHFLSHSERGIRAMFALFSIGTETKPQTEDNLSIDGKIKSARLMRVNHAGEVAAQGLYHGHALTARSNTVRQQMKHYALEEQAHLDWCEKRLAELADHPSTLTPAWYLGSYAIGAAVGILGDKWSLGFISETERQVVEHLDQHLSRLPPHDEKSRQLLLRMREDEARHDKSAQDAGATQLPEPARHAMSTVSKIMTTTAYWI